MNDPHVEKLFYKVIPSEHTEYGNAPPISGETGDFKWQLGKDQLAIDMKTHCATENEAREIIDGHLRAWEITIGLHHRPGNLTFKFNSSIVIDRPFGNDMKDLSSSEVIELSEEIKEVIQYSEFPPFPQEFRLSPEVEMMFARYKMYREGRESLLGTAYWCLTVMEYAAGGRAEAADQYRVDLKVLRKLGELCGNRGDLREARKLKGNAGITPLKPAEREWIKSVVKRLILRAGEYAYDPVAKLQLLSMADFPVLPH